VKEAFLTVYVAHVVKKIVRLLLDYYYY